MTDDDTIDIEKYTKKRELDFEETHALRIIDGRIRAGRQRFKKSGSPSESPYYPPID